MGKICPLNSPHAYRSKGKKKKGLDFIKKLCLIRKYIRICFFKLRTVNGIFAIGPIFSKD